MQVNKHIVKTIGGLDRYGIVLYIDNPETKMKGFYVFAGYWYFANNDDNDYLDPDSYGKNLGKYKERDFEDVFECVNKELAKQYLR